MKNIKVAIAGVGNGACSLIQGLEYHKDPDDDAIAGLRHHKIGDWCRREVIARTDLGGGGLDV